MRAIWGATGRLRAAPEEAVLRVAVVAIAAVQAIVLGVLARRGSWLSDDLDFLVQGGKGFAPRELLVPVNDHIAPGLRFVYAVFAQVAPLNYDLTVVWRVLMQALAIALMGFLLLRLLGTSWWVVTGTALYALAPVSMPSFMSLSSAVNNLPTHVFGLLVLHAIVDWHSGRRHRAVAYGPLSLLISLACWEKSGLIMATALALALYLRKVPLRQWVRQSWPLGAAFAVPVVAFSILYLTHGHPSRGSWPGFGELLEEGARSFAVPIGTLAGGPWRWAAFDTAFGLADAPLAAVVLGAVVLAALLVAAWRTDPRVLLLWGSLLAYVLTTWLLVSYGRSAVFGAVFTLHYHYWSDISIPLTLAVVLSARSVHPRVEWARLAPAAVACCLVAWTAGVVVSDAGFAQSWGKNPARPYFGNVTAELDKAGPAVNLWDVSMPTTISGLLSADNRLSPVLRTAGVPFRLQGPGPDISIVTELGEVRPSTLKVWATSHTPGGCATELKGTTPVTLPLKKPGLDYGPTRWFAKLSYITNQEVRVLAELIDADGKVVAMPLPDQAWPSGFTTMYFGPSAPIQATEVRLRAVDPDDSVCLGEFELGLPVVL
ncbi:hypothetical protein [Streptomyces sp. SID13031]|uniref:hypothetical protein n=1 Tax=Streptomyces sp. SID13031 TaxID=2706046 RepID=UPI0013CD72ED|nr:hypothetical protein [Streptomyces sp. SID13031]NEA32997.1 hypothetical protein [Streptomyces sp. SID13031]